MQLEIRNAVERDGLTYNILGILAGCIIAIIFFRKISFMIVAAFPPMIAILLALGGLGWADFNLNMFLNVMTPLIMVISFSDSMQLTFAARDRLIAGQDKYTAFKNAVLVVGPGLRADPRHRRHFLHRAAVLRFRPDPQIRRGGACRHHHRADRGAVAGAGVRRAAGAQRKGLCGQIPGRRRRRSGAAQFLLLDRGAHGQPSRAVQPDRGDLRRRPRRHLRQSGAALSACRPGAGQAAGGGGQRAGSTPSSPAPIRSTC